MRSPVSIAASNSTSPFVAIIDVIPDIIQHLNRNDIIGLREVDRLFKAIIDEQPMTANPNWGAKYAPSREDLVRSLPKALAYNTTFKFYNFDEYLHGMLLKYPGQIGGLELKTWTVDKTVDALSLELYTPQLKQLMYLSVNFMLRPSNLTLLKNLVRLECRLPNLPSKRNLEFFDAIKQMPKLKSLQIRSFNGNPFHISPGDSLAALRSINHVDVSFVSVKEPNVDPDTTEFERSLDGIAHLELRMWNGCTGRMINLEFRDHKSLTIIDNDRFGFVDVELVNVDLLQYVTPVLDDVKEHVIDNEVDKYIKPRKFTWDAECVFHIE
jgi:hypothetical protein